MISVIIPSYNRAATLEKCILSVLRQRKCDEAVEVIVVDDNSTDDTPNVVERFPQVRYLRNKINIGPYYSRLQGLEMAMGERITFLDSDDWLQPVALSKMSVHNADIVSADFRYRLTRFNIAHQFNRYELNGRVSKSEIQQHYMSAPFGKEGILPVSVCAKLYDTSMLRNISFPAYNSNWGEDRIFLLYALNAANNMYCIGDSVYNYRWGGGTRKYCVDDLEKYVYWHRQTELSAKELNLSKFMPCADEALMSYSGYYARNSILHGINRYQIENKLTRHLGLSCREAAEFYDKELKMLKKNRFKYLVRRFL